jgi:hypothetical protein
MRSVVLSVVAMLTAVVAMPAVSQTLTVSVTGMGKVTGAGIDCGAQGPDCTERLLPTSIGLPRPGRPVGTVVLTASGQIPPAWGGACQGTTGMSCTVAVPGGGAAVTVAFATFDPGSGVSDALRALQEAQAAASISGAPVGPGKITYSLSGAATDLNTVVTYRAEPNPGASFGHWSGRCEGTDPVCTKTVNEAMRTPLRAFFGWTVTVEIQGAGGRVTGGRIDCPTTCSARFVPPTVSLRAVNTPGSPTTTGWGFVRWGGDCASAATSPTCLVPITRNMRVTASFLPTSIRVP